MEVILPAFPVAIIWVVVAIEVIVAAIVCVMLRFTTKLEWADILKGAGVFLFIALAIAGLAIWYIMGVWDDQVRVAALQDLGYSYVTVEGNVWLGVMDNAFERGIFFQLSPGDLWTIRVLPVQ